MPTKTERLLEIPGGKANPRRKAWRGRLKRASYVYDNYFPDRFRHRRRVFFGCLYHRRSSTAATNFHYHRRAPDHDHNYGRTTRRASIFEHNYDHCGHAAASISCGRKRFVLKGREAARLNLAPMAAQELERHN
jgi:hypothetical protein